MKEKKLSASNFVRAAKCPKKIALFVILVFAAAVCIVVMLPQSLDFVIQKVQIAMGRALRKPEKWRDILCACSRVALYFILIAAFLNFTKIGAQIFFQTKNAFFDFFKNFKTRAIIFRCAVIAAFFLFCFFAVFTSGYFYQDDVFRHVSGDRSWIGFSRYVSEFLSMLFHTGRKISDIAPLAQFFAVAFMTFEVALLSHIFLGRISLFLMLGFSLVFINPLFSQCISFRYDSPYMTLAVVFPTIPFLLCKNSDMRIFSFVAIFFLVLCNMAYQAGASVFIILAIFEVYRRFQNKEDSKKTLTFMCAAIFSFAASLLLFKFVLMVPQSGDEYFSVKLNVFAIPKNIATYLTTAFKFFGGKFTQIFLIALFAFSFFVQAKNSKQKKCVSILLTIVAFLLSLVLSFGAYIVFERPIFAPRAFMGFGFFVGILSALTFLNAQKKFFTIPIFCLMFGCTVFYYAYGNALRDQKTYQDFRVQLLLCDLNKFADCTKEKKITLLGTVGLSNGFASAKKTFPIIEHLISALPHGSSTWNDEIFNFYNFNCAAANFPNEHGFPLLLSTNYHDIYGHENDFFVVLK